MTVNQSGIKSVADKVLIRVDRAEEKTKGGFILSAESLDAREQAEVYGEIVDYGHQAFISWPDDEKPKAGQRVVFEKYAGVYLEGFDGQMYRQMYDSSIGGLISFTKEEMEDERRRRRAQEVNND